MKGRRMFGAVLAAGAVVGMVAAATPAGAQVRVGIRVDWDWGTVDVRAGDGVRYADGRWADYRDLRYGAVRYVEVTGFRVPRGHRPRPGFCRLWYPGVAAGRQPRPVPCHALRGRFHPDVLIVTWDRVLVPDFGIRRVRYASAPRVVWRRDVYGVADYRVRWDDDRWDDRGWYYDARYDDDRDDGGRNGRDGYDDRREDRRESGLRSRDVERRGRPSAAVPSGVRRRPRGS